MSFINPAFLFAIGAAILPVLYHLVRKMRAKKVPFSSLMFLKATPKELVRKRRLRDLFLMAVRSAIFGLLAFAFARPFLPEEQIPFISREEQKSVALLVDVSFSMQYGDWFERARQEALERIEDLGSEDELTVIAFSDDAEQLTPLSTDRSLHQGVLQNNLKPGNRTTDYYRPLRLAEEVLRGARHEDRVVVLISDFQQSGWDGTLENWKLPEQIRFVPVSVSDSDIHNDYIQDFFLARKRKGSEVALRYDTRIGSSSENGAQRRTLRLTVNGEPVEEQQLDENAPERISFQRIASREGAFQATLALEDDDLPIDNRYYFSYTIEERPHLLCIDGSEGNAPRDAFFLGSAFNLGDDALYRFTTASPQQLRAGTLSNVGAVFLTGVNRLSDTQIQAVTGYLEDGGSVIISFGESSNPGTVSDMLTRFGIGRATEYVTPRDVQSFDAIIGEVDLRHPVFNVFSGSGVGTILRPKFRRYLTVEPDSGTTVLASYDTGDPFLLERRVGTGKILVYTSSFGTAWTDFPIHETFVPFVYQLVGYALEGTERKNVFMVGETVPLRGQPGDEWEVRTPGDNLYKVKIDDRGTGFFRETDEPGHYTAARGREQYFFAVNVDPRESDLQTRDPEEVYAAVVPPSREITEDPETIAELAVKDEEARQKFWRYVILLVLVLFAFETYYANRPAGSKVAFQRRNSHLTRQKVNA